MIASATQTPPGCARRPSWTSPARGPGAIGERRRALRAPAPWRRGAVSDSGSGRGAGPPARQRALGAIVRLGGRRTHRRRAGASSPTRVGRLGTRHAWRAAGTASPSKVSNSPRVAVVVAGGRRGGRRGGFAAARLDRLEANRITGCVAPPAPLAASIRRLRASPGNGILEQRSQLWLVKPWRSGRRSRACTDRPAGGEDVDVDLSRSVSGPSARVITERWGWTSACSAVSFPRATLADQGVVLGQADQVAVEQQVGPRVADVGDETSRP